MKVIDEIINQIGNDPLWESWYIKEKVGEGAFGAVYRIESVKQNRVDVSALKIQIVTTDGQRFTDNNKRLTYLEHRRMSVENESAIMHQLKDCPNIVAYEDDTTRELYINGYFEGYYSLIRMEYLSNVYTMMRSGEFDFSEHNVIKLARDIGNGIKAAHDNNIIHRDIKPENLFMSKKGVYKLGDFGIAKQAVSTRSLAGADGYIAPEVYTATTSVDSCYTNQADIYSFGICLYQMMNNGFFPLENEDCPLDDAISLRLQNKPFGRPVNASDAFSHIIMKACAFKCKDRYKSINEMLIDLNNIDNSSNSYNYDNIKNTETVYVNSDKQNVKKNNINKSTIVSILSIIACIIIITFIVKFKIAPKFSDNNDHESSSIITQADKGTDRSETESKTEIVAVSEVSDNVVEPMEEEKTEKPKEEVPQESEEEKTEEPKEETPEESEEEKPEEPEEETPKESEEEEKPEKTKEEAPEEPEEETPKEPEEEPQETPDMKKTYDFYEIIYDVTADSQLEDQVYSDGSYSYAPWKVIDGDLTTCWSEGDPEYGIGDSITIEFDDVYTINEITLWNGLCTSSDLFYKNSRICGYTMIFSDGTIGSGEIPDGYENRKNIIKLPYDIETSSVQLVIDSVYAGSKYKDTCISEIQVSYVAKDEVIQ